MLYQLIYFWGKSSLSHTLLMKRMAYLGILVSFSIAVIKHHDYGGLSKNGPHRLIDLNAESPRSGTT